MTVPKQFNVCAKYVNNVTVTVTVTVTVNVTVNQAPVPEKTISANRGLNPANQGIKFVLRLDCVPQNTISTIPGIK